MKGSALVDKIIPAYTGNYNNQRYGNVVKKITIHHIAGVWSIERLGELWQTKGREGSSHYGIGNDGRIGQYVDENHTAWTDSNRTSNRTSITIETSNSEIGGDWLVSDEALNSLIKLVADISKRYNMPLIKRETVTWHSMYANTTCPGKYLLSKMDYIIEQANNINQPKYPFAIGTTVYPAQDIFLYSNAGYENPTIWKLSKGIECIVSIYHDVNGIYMALKDIQDNYFPSAWTNEFNKFTIEKPIIEPTKEDLEKTQELPTIPSEGQNNPVEPQTPQNDETVEEEQNNVEDNQNEVIEPRYSVLEQIIERFVNFIINIVIKIIGGKK